MSPLQLSSALTHQPPDSADLAASRQPNRVPHSTLATQIPAKSALLILTGCLSAAMIASLACRLPKAHTLSWTTIVSLSIKYIAITTIAGAIGTSLPWLFLSTKPSFGLRFLSKSIAVAWIFFPCITLFYRQQSPGMFLALALATVALAFSLRRLFPANADSDPTALPPGYTSDLPNLYGLPIADFRPIRAFVIAICAQTALILAIAGYLFFAGALLSTSLAMFVWRWTAWIAARRKIHWQQAIHPPLCLRHLLHCFRAHSLACRKIEPPERCSRSQARPDHSRIKGLRRTRLRLRRHHPMAATRKKDGDRSTQTAFRFVRNRKSSQTCSHSIRRAILVLQSTEYTTRPTCSRSSRKIDLRQRPLHRLGASLDGRPIKI